MNDHYYSQQPTSQHDPKHYTWVEEGTTFQFETDRGVFSRDGLDYGSQVLIKTVRKYWQTRWQSLLELGSGYGPVAIILKKLSEIDGQDLTVTGIELNQRAYDLAQTNQQLNQVKAIQWIQNDVTKVNWDMQYDCVVTNPPIRAGKQTIQAFVDQAAVALKPGGELYVVIQKKQGAPSMRDYMVQRFDNVERLKQDRGYWNLRSIKQEGSD